MNNSANFMRRFAKTTVAIATVVSAVHFLVTGRPVVAAENAALLSAVRSITSNELQRHVDVLADDSFEGREAGSRGGHAASVYLRKSMTRYGLAPLGTDGDYFQMFGGQLRNVLGLLEGSHPELKDEVILVCAHYDHVGYGNRGNSYGPFGYVHNGADDNASGTSGLLELIDALDRLETTPDRSILFAFWDGEEKGLLGSKYFAAHPPLPIRRIKMVINMDMIGRLRDDTLSVYGSRTSIGARRLLAQQNTDMILNFSWEVKENSDHWPFYQRGIPYLMLHTGLHDDYHRPRDDAHKINSAGMERVVQLLLETVYKLANADVVPAFRSRSRRESPASQRRLEQPLPPAPMRLGIAWQDIDDAADGLRITRVVVGSPADRAGLRAGDRIVQFDGRPMTSSARLRSAVVAADNPVSVLIARGGNDDALDLTVQLAGRPQRLGLSWRSDDAEPGTVLVTRVIPGSPAANSGLQVNDRIYQVNGRNFADRDELLQMARSLPSPLTLLVERRGRLEDVELALPPELATAPQHAAALRAREP